MPGSSAVQTWLLCHRGHWLTSVVRVPRVVTHRALLETYLQHRPLSFEKADRSPVYSRVGDQSTGLDRWPVLLPASIDFQAARGFRSWPQSSRATVVSGVHSPSRRPTRNTPFSSFEKLDLFFVLLKPMPLEVIFFLPLERRVAASGVCGLLLALHLADRTPGADPPGAASHRPAAPPPVCGPAPHQRGPPLSRPVRPRWVAC